MGSSNVLSSGNDSLRALLYKETTTKVTETFNDEVINYSFQGSFWELNCHPSISMPILNEVCSIEFPLHKAHVKLEHNWCTASSKPSPLQNKVVH
jgi:hypothetical protein